MTFINPTTTSEVAIVLAAASLSLQVVATLAKSRSVAIDEPAEPPSVVVTPSPLLYDRPSLKLSRQQLLEHARALGVGNARFRNSASKIRLLEAIRAHNQERRAA